MFLHRPIRTERVSVEVFLRLYDQKFIQATLADRSTDTGWVYIINSLPTLAKVIQSGDWRKRVKNL